jgi:flavin reductase (DIM6/NTAB) family NADH-FMN oxidoreductase RutF
MRAPLADAPVDLARRPDFDSAYFRTALGQFATGVTIITTRAAGAGGPQLLGFTANSFNSVSLDPPLVLWSLARSASSLAAFLDIAHYAINVLASDQIALSRRFGSSSRQGAAAPLVVDRFEGIAWREGSHGAPILEGCCAWFECFNRSRYEEGDHVIFVGEVERCGFEEREPLIFQAGDYHMTQPHPDR